MNMKQRRGMRWLAVLGAAGIAMSGCQAWLHRHPTNEVGVDTELTTHPPLETPSPVKPPAPRPEFEQEPKQAP